MCEALDSNTKFNDERLKSLDLLYSLEIRRTRGGDIETYRTVKGLDSESEEVVSTSGRVYDHNNKSLGDEEKCLQADGDESVE